MMAFEVRLPEQISLHLKPAGYPTRAIAYAIDFGLRWTALVLVILAGGLLLFLVVDALGESSSFWDVFDQLRSLFSTSNAASRAAIVIGVLLIFLVEWVYPVYFEVFRGGATPGKHLLGIRVTDEVGLPISFRAGAIRSLLRLADTLPFAGILAGMIMIFSKKRQRLGDIAAGTVVVFDPPASRAHRLPNRTPAGVEISENLFYVLEQYLARETLFTIPARAALEEELVSKLIVQLPSTLHPTPGEGRTKWLREIYSQSVPGKPAARAIKQQEAV